MKEKSALLIRILEYCYQKEIFTLNDINDSLELSVNDLNYVHKIRTDNKVAHQNEILVLDSKVDGGNYMTDNYRLSVGATFQYLDFVELKEARISSKTAKTQSFWAIIIALFALLVGLIQTLIAARVFEE